MGRTQRRSLELDIVLDERAITSAAEEVENLRRQVDDLESSELSLAQASKKAAGSLDDLGDNSTVRSLRLQADALEANIKALDEYIRKAQQASKADDGIGGRAGGLFSESNAQAQGDISTSLGGAASIVGNIPGLGGAGSALAGLGDISGFLEYIPRLNEALLTTGTITPKVVSAITGLNTAVTAAAGPIAGTAVSFGAVALAAAPVVIALAAAAFAIKQFTDALNSQKATLDSAYDAQVEYYTLIETQTKEQIEDTLRQREIEKAAREQALRDLNAQIEATNPLIVQALGLNKLRKEEEERINDLNVEIGALNRAAQDTKVSSEEAGKAIEDELNKSLKDLSEQAKKTGEDVKKVFEEAEPFIAGTTLSFNRAALQQARNRATEAQKKIDDLTGKLDEDSAKVRIDTETKIRKAEEEAMKDRAEAVKESADRIADIERDSARRLEDLAYAEQSAIFNRDAIALAEAKRAKEQEIEDRELAINDEKAALKDELSDIRTSAQERIATLKAEEAERIATLRASYEEQKALEAEFLDYRSQLLQDRIEQLRGNGGRGVGASVGAVPQLDGGGYIQKPGLAMLHAGEQVLTAEQTRKGGAGFSIGSMIFNISGGGSPQETAQAVRETLDKELPRIIASAWAKAV